MLGVFLYGRFFVGYSAAGSLERTQMGGRSKLKARSIIMKAAGTALIILTIMSLMTAPARAGWWQVEQHCQILDVPSEPVYKVSCAVIPESSFDDYGDSASMEIEGLWKLPYLRDILWGDIDSRLVIDSVYFVKRTALDLPHQAMGIYLDSGWTVRMIDGTSWQARVRPGIFSDMTGIGSGDLFMPFSLAFIKSFNQDLSAMLGVEVRPGFERALMPQAGIEWEFGGSARLEAGVPESRLEYFLSSRWTTHLGLEWRNRSFRIHEDVSGDPDMLTLDDFAGWWGLTYRVSDEMHLFADYGWLFGRSVEFSGHETGAESDVDISSTAFARIALGGPF